MGRGDRAGGAVRANERSFTRTAEVRKVAITVVAMPRRLGRLPSVVAVHTGTPQRTRRGKIARAAVVVVPRPIPRFTG